MRRFSRWNNYINRYQIGLLGLLIIIAGIVFTVPPMHFLVIFIFIVFIGMFAGLATYLFIPKKKTAIIIGTYVSGLLILRALMVLDSLNFVLLSAVTVTTVMLFKES